MKTLVVVHVFEQVLKDFPPYVRDESFRNRVGVPEGVDYFKLRVHEGDKSAEFPVGKIISFTEWGNHYEDDYAYEFLSTGMVVSVTAYEAAPELQ